MLKLLLWLLLFVVCWPLALLALILYPLVWLLSLPFRLLGITLEAVFSFLKALLFLPARLLGGPKAAREDHQGSLGGSGAGIRMGA
jgi:hypothetical protein